MSQNGEGYIPLLKQHLECADRYLRPEAIYSLNRVLYEFLDTLKITPPPENGSEKNDGHCAWVVPFLFDQYTRSWHFACVLPHVWEDHSVNCEVIKEILWLLTKMACKPSWQLFHSNAKLLAGKDFDSAYQRTLGRVKKIKDYDLANNEISSFLPDVAKKDIDVNAFISFKEKGINKIAELVGIVNEDGDGNPDAIKLLVRDLLLVYHGYQIHRGALLSGVMYRALRDLGDGEVLFRLEGMPEEEGSLNGTGKLFVLANNRNHKYEQLDYCLEDSRKFNKDLYADQWGDLSLPFYVRETFERQKKLGGKLPFIVLPIHDTWLGNVGYGGLWGCLLCTFMDESSRGNFVHEVLEKLKPVCEILSAELTMSALATIGGHPIEPPYDLVEHFVKVIVYIQDWESVKVFRSGKALYYYKRTPEGGDYNNDFAWRRCAPSDGCDHGCGRGKILSWKDCVKETILSNEFIPELTSEEIESFGDICLEFEYPKTARVPQDSKDPKDKTHELFKLAVIQRQIEVLRALIPKVRARRAALRSAVSAIMGRNMSHNIGSHVLARYSSAIKHDLNPANKDNTDHRTDFLSYLQRRMDFLAEVATSYKAFWEQPLSLYETINKLNIKEQRGRINADDPCSATCSEPSTPATLNCSRRRTPTGAKKDEPILLSYITGKESLVANVEWGYPLGTAKEEVLENVSYFSCPGGEVGAHALYVILENIIRNSARHAKSDDGTSVDIYVAAVVDKTAEADNLIKLTIIDPRTLLDREGWVIEQGNRVDTKSLTDHIKKILTEEPFLNEDGSANPKYWGVREMQICAHYLRGLSLGDLEGKQESPLVLEASPWGYVKDGATEYYLSYTLYLKRTQLLAYLSESENKNEKRDNEFLSRGIKPIYREQVTNQKNAIDWKKLSGESRGYSFLMLSPDLMCEYEKEPKAKTASNTDGKSIEQPASEPVKHQLPVRIIGMDSEAVNNLIDNIKEDTSLNWMRPLHEAILDKYRKNGPERAERWGNGKVYAVVGWHNKHIVNETGGTTDSLPIRHVSRVDQGCWCPFASLPDELPIREPRDNVGLAWLDHPNNSDLTREVDAATASASIDVGPNYVNWASVEPMWSDSPHIQMLLNAMQNNPSDGIHELAAAAFARVVVLDERIQSRRHDIVRAVTLYKYWPQVGIWCPLHRNDVKGKSVNGVIQQPIVKDADAYHQKDFACDLDEPEFKDIHSFLLKPTKVAYQLPADFLVLHLTILERLNKKQPEESINTTLSKLIQGTQCEHAQIIIVTGRGVPTAARHRDGEGRVDARYLPISALQEFLVTRPSKLGLMRVLWAAAAPGN